MRALEVLEANWLGHGTRPSRLYPHQWSWDSACIAMGYARWNQLAAETELRSLFAGQWANGLLPHIVFAVGNGRYFPGPEFWQSERSPDAPSDVRTSGIVQPPLHATAAWRLFRQSRDRDRGIAVPCRARTEAPRLARVPLPRADAGRGWAGRDLAPLGVRHGQLSALGRGSRADRPDGGPDPRVPACRRRARRTRRSDRPTRSTTATCTSSGSSATSTIAPTASRRRRRSPSSPCCSTRCSCRRIWIWRRSRGSSATIPATYEDWAQLTAVDLDARLWSEPDALYVDYDLQSGKHVTARTAAGLAPLYAGVPSPERARRMVERLAGSRVEVNASGWAVTSLSPDDPGYLPTRYWRGPIWPILNWVLQRGLDRYGFTTLASEVRRALIDLAGRSGFWEHYGAATGAGQGGENFAWTAGLVLDILSIEMESEEEGAPMEDAAITPAVDGSPHRATNGGSEMSDERNDSFGLEEPFDRRTLLGKAAMAGGVLAAGGLLTARRASAGPAAAAGDVTAFFGQFGAIAEQEGIRKYVFKGFNGDVDAVFAPITAPNLFVDRVRAEAKAGQGLDRRSRRPPRRLRHLPERRPHSRRRRRCEADQRAAGAVGQAREARAPRPSTTSRTPRRPT